MHETIKWKNGNYHVVLELSGTKTRVIGDGVTPDPEWPESVDVKLTNKCNGGCPWCHENSTPDGKHFVPDDAVRFFNGTPCGVELAFGGGNPIEARKDFEWFSRNLERENAWSCLPVFNITVNAKHLKSLSEHPFFLYNFTAMGISWSSALKSQIRKFIEENSSETAVKNCVIHVIAGAHKWLDVFDAFSLCDRVLILGYKKFGRGREFFGPVDRELKQWRDNIDALIKLAAKEGKTLAFDNLAIEQLSPERFFTKENWEKMYMGGDGKFSMYVDLVKMEYAKSSFSEERFPIGDKTLKEAFAHVKTL